MFYNNPEKREWWLDQHDDVETKTGLVDEPTVGTKEREALKTIPSFGQLFCLVLSESLLQRGILQEEEFGEVPFILVVHV